MDEGRDPVIKLFGKTIQLLAIGEVLAAAGEEGGGFEKKFLLKAPSNKEDKEDERIDKHNISETTEERIEDQKSQNGGNSMEKTLKKPDKILPCPRCNSMDTKFCYFNNYNVNQPRHFCKNCQRYWTEGGNMRNVPVGAGRRKSKSSTTNPHCHHHITTIPDCVQADSCESFTRPSPLKQTGTVLSLDPNGEDKLNRPLTTTLNSNDEGKEALMNSNCHAFPPYLNGTPWPNPWRHTAFDPSTPFSSTPWLCSGLNSTVLGKHSREGNTVNHGDSAKSENCLWIPKTVKINDNRSKSAKCSLWAKLGFKNDKSDRFLKNRSTEASQVLRANPAALSRSLSFQDRSPLSPSTTLLIQ